MEVLNIEKGGKALYKGRPVIILRVLDLSLVTIEEVDTNVITTVAVSTLQPFVEAGQILDSKDVHALTEEEWAKAQKRYQIIKPVLEKKNNLSLIKEISNENDVHYTTIYRWIKLFESTGLVSTLVGRKKTGGKGKSRLDTPLETIIKDTIDKVYLNSSKKSINKVIREIDKACKSLNLEPPHPNTIRNRIKNLSEEEVLKSRYGSKAARYKYEAIKGNFPGAHFPLSVVQIDHTKLDIILVDEQHRKPFQRPWITVAIDVFSRMVLGFYLSFDPPGEMGTGMCIANSILPKENLLSKNKIEADWPCWGIMKTIHLDNAKEFKGNMLRRACENYGIELEYRPVATPHWGGHIERLLGTFSKEIHNLSGTTFSNPKERQNYDSEKNASLSISDLERWLCIFISNVYHIRTHSSLGMSPLEKYKEGIFGNNGTLGTGIHPRPTNERRLRLDFMPFVERTIQEYGIIIDRITYYDEVLRRYIHSKESIRKNSAKRKFTFRRDPRDISIVYFYDPELNEYYEIPYRNISQPPMSIWEYNAAVKNLRERNVNIDEDAIFNAYSEMERIEEQAIIETKKLKRVSRHADKRTEMGHRNLATTEGSKSTQTHLSIPNIKPFDDIDDEAFK